MMVFLFSPMSYADMGESLVLCKHNKNVRTLRVEMGADQKCRAIYTKQGVMKRIVAAGPTMLALNTSPAFVKILKKQNGIAAKLKKRALPVS